MTADPRTWDLFAADEQIEYATETVTIVRDRQAALEYSKLSKQFNRTVDKDDVADLESQLAELKKKIVESSYTVTLKGMSPASADKIIEDVKKDKFPDVTDDNPEVNRVTNAALLEKMFVSFVDHAGNPVKQVPQGPDVLRWYDGLPNESKAEILDTVALLTYESVKLDFEVNNADF